MSSPIGILDYGCGNIKSVSNALKACGYDSKLVTNVAELDDIEKLVLPGVGAFDYAVESITATGIVEALIRWTEDESKMLLGICLGMQLLCRGSEESLKNYDGLGLIDAYVKKLDSPKECRLPNIGWSEVIFKNPEYTQNNGDYYFVHSYGAYCDKEENVLAYSHYGDRKFSSAITNGRNIYGYQFHPEKSQKKGLALLSNFAKL